MHRSGEAALEADDQEVLVTANASLHSHIVSMSRNKVLADLIGSVDRRVRWYYLPIARARGKDAWDEHAELIAAIADGDEPRAAGLMRRHTERTREITTSGSRRRPRGTPDRSPWAARGAYTQSANVGSSDSSVVDARGFDAATSLRPG